MSNFSSPVILVLLAVIAVGGLFIVLSLVGKATHNSFADSIEKGDFDVILQSSGETQVVLIKEIRVITKLGLVEAKQLVDTAPSLILEGVSEGTALRAKEKLEAAGGSVVIK